MRLTNGFGTVKVVMLKGEQGAQGIQGEQGIQGIQGEPFEFEDFTVEQLDELRGDIASIYYKKEEATYHTVGENTTSIEIPFASYTDHDMLFVDVEGLALTQGVDYTIEGKSIVLTEPITHHWTAVNFRALRAIAITADDYEALKGDGISKNTVVSIDSYEGATNEDKLYAALDSVTSGVILCGNVTITKVYNALAKDYRNITIQGATFNLTIDEWFNQASSTSKSVVQFDSCVINGNGHTIFSAQYNAIGMRFDSCTLNNVTAYSSATGYAQSPYFNGCNMFNVGNLITATIAYDFKMVGCRVEAAASGILFSFTDSGAIRQGVVSNCLIEGRGDVVFSVGGMYAFTIENCYFEALNGGLLVQNGSSAASFLRVFDCAFFETMANTDYAITLNSSSFGFAIIRRNVTNFPIGKYLCNRHFVFATRVGNANSNYSHGFANDGSPAFHDRNMPVQATYKTDAVWDADNSAWQVKFMLDYEEAYQGLHPIYVVFQASYGSAAQFAGFAIVRLTPRTAWNGSAIVTVCDATLVDSCNSNSMTKASSVSVSVDLSANGAGNPNIVYTLSIKGFNNLKVPRYRVIDPWYFVGAYNVPAE